MVKHKIGLYDPIQPRSNSKTGLVATASSKRAVASSKWYKSLTAADQTWYTARAAVRELLRGNGTSALAAARSGTSTQVNKKMGDFYSGADRDLVGSTTTTTKRTAAQNKAATNTPAAASPATQAKQRGGFKKQSRAAKKESLNRRAGAALDTLRGGVKLHSKKINGSQVTMPMDGSGLTKTGKKLAIQLARLEKAAHKRAAKRGASGKPSGHGGFMVKLNGMHKKGSQLSQEARDFIEIGLRNAVLESKPSSRGNHMTHGKRASVGGFGRLTGATGSRALRGFTKKGSPGAKRWRQYMVAMKRSAAEAGIVKPITAATAAKMRKNKIAVNEHKHNVPASSYTHPKTGKVISRPAHVKTTYSVSAGPNAPKRPPRRDREYLAGMLGKSIDMAKKGRPTDKRGNPISNKNPGAAAAARKQNAQRNADAAKFA